MDYDHIKRLLQEALKSEDFKSELKETLIAVIHQESQRLPEKKYLTAEEVCGNYGVCKRTLLNWEYAGLKSVRIGRAKFFDIDDLNNFFYKNKS